MDAVIECRLKNIEKSKLIKILDLKILRRVKKTRDTQTMNAKGI
jgi:hypothetical protein